MTYLALPLCVTLAIPLPLANDEAHGLLFYASYDKALDADFARGTREATVQEHFVRSVQAGREPENSMQCGLAVMRIIDGVYRASATGRDVVLAG